MIVDVQGFTQWPTYPQLLVKGELLGGCDIVMEMQQDGSLKTAIQEALGADPDTQTAVQQRIKELLDSKPVMLFMKVMPCAACMQCLCHRRLLELASRQSMSVRYGIQAAETSWSVWDAEQCWKGLIHVTYHVCRCCVTRFADSKALNLARLFDALYAFVLCAKSHTLIPVIAACAASLG